MASRGNVKCYYGIRCGHGCGILTSSARHADLALVRGRDVVKIYFSCDFGPYLLFNVAAPHLHPDIIRTEVVYAIPRATALEGE
jgi:hypothetical protein